MLGYSFKNPLVVGYKGEVGSCILSGLIRWMPKALNIWCFDTNESIAERIERIKRADVIFLCVPLQDTVAWLFQFKKYLKGKVIFEQTSIKSYIYEHKCLKDMDNILSMHLLFRPSATPNKVDRVIGLVRTGKLNRDWWKYELEIKSITQSSKVVWFEDYKSHDIIMARQQALVHRTILVLSSIIGRDMAHSYVGQQILELRDRILVGDPTLYRLIQSNKYLKPELEIFKKELDKFGGIK